MSTMVQMPVRVKPPPADTGDTISPGCASFEMATPLKGARMIVLSSSVRCDDHLAFGDAHLLAQRANARVDRFDFRLRRIDFRRRDEAVLHELFAASQRPPRFGEANFVLGDPALRALDLCERQPERGTRGRVVEPGQHLTLADGHAFVDVHFDDLAGDFRRDGGAAPRRDVARRVQHRGLRPRGALGDGDRFDFDRTLARGPQPYTAAGAAEQDQQDDPLHPSAAAGAHGGSLDAQCRQIAGWIARGRCHGGIECIANGRRKSNGVTRAARGTEVPRYMWPRHVALDFVPRRVSARDTARCSSPVASRWWRRQSRDGDARPRPCPVASAPRRTPSPHWCPRVRSPSA